MKGRAQSFPLSKLSKFPQNKKASPRRKQNACEGRCEAKLRNRLTVAGRKKLKKNPPKNGSSPLAFDGALRESPPAQKNSASKQTTCSRRINYGSFISDGSKRQSFLNPPSRPKIKRLEVARKRRASFKPTYIDHYSFYSFIFQITLRRAHRF